MKQFSTVVVCALLAASVLAHDGHDHADQMPLGYVKYPYQAVYPGDNEGRSPGLQYGVVLDIHLISEQ